MKRLFVLFLSSISVISCSPLYSLFVQNGSDEPIKLYVELKDKKYNQKFKKVFEKRNVYNSKKIENIDGFEIDSIRYFLQSNKVSEKKYNFTSDLTYNFTLEPNLLTNVDPNNGLPIYPFEKIYYAQNGKKCFIVPKTENQECNFKTISKQRLKKNKTVKTYSDFIEIQNLK